jgi:hypothetical protein
MKKRVPKFKNEEAERDFWKTNDSANYLNWEEAENVRFPDLKFFGAKLSDPVRLVREGRELQDAQIMLAVMDEKYFRKIALEKGIDWEAITEEERIQFVRELGKSQ